MQTTIICDIFHCPRRALNGERKGQQLPSRRRPAQPTEATYGTSMEAPATLAVGDRDAAASAHAAPPRVVRELAARAVTEQVEAPAVPRHIDVLADTHSLARHVLVEGRGSERSRRRDTQPRARIALALSFSLVDQVVRGSKIIMSRTGLAGSTAYSLL